MNAVDEPEVADGWVAEPIRAELGGLRLRTLVIEGGSGRTSRELRHRLRLLSDRFRGATAVALRTQAVPSAYRVLFRQLGLDPDATRTPVEEAAIRRLVHGSFQATNAIDDALTVALVETGVPLWAIDADRVVGALGIAAGDGGRSLAVVHEEGRVGPLFGEVERDLRVTRGTRRTLLFAVQAPGVPSIFVEEAMWLVVGLLGERG